MTIKEKREKLYITQSKLAERTGVSSRTIRRYENGWIDKFKVKYTFAESITQAQKEKISGHDKEYR